MKVELKEIKSFPAELSLVAQPDELDFELAEVRLAEGVGLDLSIQQTDNEYILSGQCSATAEMDCARCLETAHLELHGEISLIAIRPISDEADKFDSNGDSEQEVTRLDVNESLNLDDVIRRALFSEIPHKPLCREDCKGLCPVCGANRNEQRCGCDTEQRDSRWDALSDAVEE